MDTFTPVPAPDKAAILLAVSVLAWESQVVELRALEVSPKQQTSFGYFSDHKALAEAVARVTKSAAGVYVSLNPINPALLARASNKLRVAARSTALTADAEALIRVWLPIDRAPVRPKGISATDAEHDIALTRAVEIRNALRAKDWPDPIIGDSGNGAHLYVLE